jgi:hypothetical protein
MNTKAAWLLQELAVNYSDYTSVMNRKFIKRIVKQEGIASKDMEQAEEMAQISGFSRTFAVSAD